VKRGNWCHLGYSNTPYVLWKKLEERVRSDAKVWRLGVPGKCWQHPQAGSMFARDQCEGWNLHESLLHRMPAVTLLRNYGLWYRLIQWGLVQLSLLSPYKSHLTVWLLRWKYCLKTLKLHSLESQCLPRIHKSQLLKCTLEQLDAVHSLFTSDPLWPLKTYVCMCECL
jgi:hypothetical protein